MIKLLSIEEDLSTLSIIANVHKNLTGSYKGRFYKIELNGEEYFLNRNGFNFILYKINGDELVLSKFSMDKNYHLYSIFNYDYEIILDEENLIFLDDDGIYYFIKIEEIPDEINVEGYNGRLIFSQFNSKNMMTMAMSYSYPYKKDGSNKVFSLKNRIPFFIGFRKNIFSHQEYYSFKIDYPDFVYDIITIKEYGLKEFLQKGSYTL